MDEKTGKDELRAEIERSHFVRAALLAGSLGLSEEEVRDLRIKALWQVSAISRNGSATKSLAQQYGLSKSEVRRILEEGAKKRSVEGDVKSLEPCYDVSTGRYLAFDEWLDHYFKNWEKLSVED
jgi:hypothetical protein